MEKKEFESKKSTAKKNFHFKVLSELKIDTNLSRIRKKLGVSKENLNYYLRKLKEKGFIKKKGYGWYETTKKSENLTKYGNFLPKDFIRGHAYIIKVNFPKKIDNWNKRIDILKKSNINYNLVGILKNIPRIKALGRKVWLCNNHLRIFDKKKKSYYSEKATKSRFLALREFIDVIQVVENKLKINLKPYDIEFQKEHYALIKNDLAKDCNKKGIILRIRDEKGEWLLIDDSLGKGGELENIGKSAFGINPKMQKWWNDNKKHNFQVTPTFLMEALTKLAENQAKNQIEIIQFTNQIKSHLKLIQEYRKENIRWRKGKIKEIKEELKEGKQLNFGDFK